MLRIPNVTRGRQVQFQFDGRTVAGFERESLAVAILASGHRVLSRSLRFHRPRTMFCSTGECGWCAVEVDGLPNVHACMVRCGEGMAVHSQNAWPSAETDVFSLLDLFNRFLPNSFYHHRFMRPRFMRQFYLGIIRRFTGLGRLGGSRTGSKTKHRLTLETELVVVGAGLAGMCAAVTAAEHGASVILIDERQAPGGSWRTRADAPSVLNDLAAKVTAMPNVDYWPNSACVGIYGPRMLGVSTPEKLVTLLARQIILAPGALDALPLFVNNDLPGVMSARLVERLILAEGILPGKRAVIWGVPALREKTEAIMKQAGIEFVYQLQPGESVLAAKGGTNVRAAVVRDAAGRTRTLTCDLIIIAALQPRNELLAQAGSALGWDESASALCAQRDQSLSTSVAGLRVAGEAASLADAASCLEEGRLSGLAALRALGIHVEATDDAWSGTQQKPENSFVFPTASAGGAGHVCFCEDVREWEIRAQLNSPYSALELVKRRTAVVTGPCQGKFCLANAMRVSGYISGSPTARPPAKPLRLKDFRAE